jgi:hypothetical protein
MTTNLTDAFLDAKRKLTDQLADDVIAQIIEMGFEKEVNNIFYTLVRNDGYDPKHFASFPASIREKIEFYFTESAKLPSWADETKIAKGQELFSIYGPEVFMLLNVKSLPMCYICAKGAKVLYATGRLTEHNGQIDPLVRRLMETAQMVVNVLQRGGLAPSGSGIVTTQKVRLIHASIRYFLKHPIFNPNGWDAQNLGEPINQEDLAGTLMSFSPVILSGLKQLNIDLTDEQIEAYTHCWKVIGYLMGVDEDLLPDSFDEGWTLATRILEHQAEESMEGKALTASCIAFIKHMLPGNAFDDIPEFFIWYFFQDVAQASSKDLSNMVGISSHKTLKDEFTLKLTKFFMHDLNGLEHKQIVETISDKINLLLLQGMLTHYNDEKKVRFLIPPNLQQDWNLSDKWIDSKQIGPTILKHRLIVQHKA